MPFFQISWKPRDKEIVSKASEERQTANCPQASASEHDEEHGSGASRALLRGFQGVYRILVVWIKLVGAFDQIPLGLVRRMLFLGPVPKPKIKDKCPQNTYRRI